MPSFGMAVQKGLHMFFAEAMFGSYEIEITIKLLLASLAGGLIGLEREKHGRPAGLRTHLLVSMASCLMMIVSEAFFLKYGEIPGTSVVRLDPGRVAAQIIAGIGFIGAGVILKDGLSVRGLTTAACLWLAAGVGMGFGMGAFFPAALAAIIGISSLIFLKQLEPIIKKDRFLHLSVVIEIDKEIYPSLERIFAERGVLITDLACDYNRDRGELRYDFILTQHQRRMGRELTALISDLDGVKKIRFK